MAYNCYSTIPQLRNLAKERGLRGYSKLQKAELLEFIRKNAPRDFDDLEYYTRPKLVKLAKEMGIKGFYKLKDFELIYLIRRLRPKITDDDE